MAEVGFYHLTSSPLERALPKLLEKILENGKRAVLKCANADRLNFLNGALWTLGRISFIPHGAEADGNASDQPIWLTLKDENPNGATFLVVTDGASSEQVGDYERCLDIFDGTDAQAVQEARSRWKAYKASGHTVTYWKQSDDGSWARGDN